MAASSAKDKAHALKDSYVAGLIEGGATGPAPVMPEQDLGNTAGDVMDLKNGVVLRKNDQNPRLVIRDGARQSVSNMPFAKMPNKGQGYGATSGNAISPSDMGKMADALHSRPNHVDTISDYGSPNDLYESAMYQMYTRNP